MPELSRDDWDAWIANFRAVHLLQTGAWGDLKAAFGWQPVRWVDRLSEATVGAQILFRRLPFGYSIAYLARGPISVRNYQNLEWSQLWPKLDQICRARRAIFLRIEPDAWEEAEESTPPPPGLTVSSQTIQPPRTILVDLKGDEDQLLARMKQKTRYNIRLAEKKGVCVYPTEDLTDFFNLMTVTGKRDRFSVHSREYYQTAYDLFAPSGNCRLFQADFDSQPIAALMVFVYGERAWYLYGASSDLHREKMPAYLLQWEAMRWAKAQGALEYDLYGIPDLPESELESEFARRSDGLWGVYRFKRGFGGVIRRAAGPWDRIYMSFLYHGYQYWTKRRYLSA